MLQRTTISILWVVVIIPVLVGMSMTFLSLAPGPSSGIAFLILVELIMALFTVEILIKNLPTAHSQAMLENCSRMDGSHSSRRARREQRAVGKFRRDLWAIGLLVLLIGNAATAVVHFYVVPLPLAFNAIGSFRGNVADWKHTLQNDRVGAKVERAHQASFRISPRDASKSARLLWQALPLMLLAAGALGFGLLQIVSIGYRRALAELHQGIQMRSEKNLTRDLRALRHASETQAT